MTVTIFEPPTEVAWFWERPLTDGDIPFVFPDRADRDHVYECSVDDVAYVLHHDPAVRATFTAAAAVVLHDQ